MHSNSRAVTALSTLVLLAVGVLTYANSLSGPFIFDDKPAIVENGDIQTILPLWRSPEQSDRSSINSRPLVRLSLALNYAVGGLNVRGYHVFNIAIHLVCALLLWRLLRRILTAPGLPATVTAHAEGLAFSIALLWLVHPLNSQVVNYITQRSESLVALLYLATLYGLTRSAESGDRRWSLVASACCLLGMGAKEVMVTAPVVALLYDRALLAGSFAAALRQRLGLHLANACSWLLLLGLLWGRPHGDSIGFAATVGPFENLLNQSVSLVTYLRLSLWPSGLLLDYGFPQTLSWFDVSGELLAVGLLLGVTILSLSRYPVQALAGAWFFVILSPTSSFVPIVGEVAAERRMYLPLMAVLAVVVVAAWWGLERLRPRLQLSSRAGMALAVIVVALVTGTAVAATARRNTDYLSPESIWRDVVAERAANPRGHSSLGAAIADEGRWTEALAHYDRALTLAPMYSTAHYNKANALLHTGRPQEAAAHYRRCLATNPQDAQAHANLGAALQSLGDLTGAEGHFREAVTRNPRLPVAHNNLGIVLASRGETPEAMQHFRVALSLDPAYAIAHNNLAYALESVGDTTAALEHYRQALRSQPDLEAAAARLQALTGHRLAH